MLTESILLKLLFVTATLLIINQTNIKVGIAGAAQEEIITLKIINGELSDSPEVIRVFEGTDLTLIIKSDGPLILHLHGYDISTKVDKTGQALMKLNSFATGRFPIKIHPSVTEHQGSEFHERTLLYLEVHPN